MLVTDDHSSFKIVRVWQAKSDVESALGRMFDLLELKVGRHVQRTRSDRGRESGNADV
jgi:hypothetical protein